MSIILSSKQMIDLTGNYVKPNCSTQKARKKLDEKRVKYTEFMPIEYLVANHHSSSIKIFRSNDLFYFSDEIQITVHPDFSEIYEITHVIRICDSKQNISDFIKNRSEYGYIPSSKIAAKLTAKLDYLSVTCLEIKYYWNSNDNVYICSTYEICEQPQPLRDHDLFEFAIKTFGMYSTYFKDVMNINKIFLRAPRQVSEEIWNCILAY